MNMAPASLQTIAQRPKGRYLGPSLDFPEEEFYHPYRGLTRDFWPGPDKPQKQGMPLPFEACLRDMQQSHNDNYRNE